ncbi:hypothetical protein C0993_004624, partial [Termitomyces sp. T159_Od127]
MAKQGFEAARNAARAANPTPNVHTDKNKAPASGGKVYTQLTGPGGKVYLVEDGDLGKLQTLSVGTASTPVGFAGLVTDSVPSSSAADDSEWEGWMAIIEEEELQASINWKQNSVAKPDFAMIAPLSQTQSTALTTIDDQPFY